MSTCCPRWDYSSIDSWALGDNNFSHKKQGVSGQILLIHEHHSFSPQKSQGLPTKGDPRCGPRGNSYPKRLHQHRNFGSHLEHNTEISVGFRTLLTWFLRSSLGQGRPPLQGFSLSHLDRTLTPGPQEELQGDQLDQSLNLQSNGQGTVQGSSM